MPQRAQNGCSLEYHSVGKSSGGNMTAADEVGYGPMSRFRNRRTPYVAL